MITLIAAVGRRREIGLDNKLLWNIPEDMKHFKEYTTGKVVVMGRKTFDSIGRTLPGRKNVIMTNSVIPNILCVKSIKEIQSIEHCYPEIVVIGGESVYNQTIKIADKLVITEIDQEFDADTYFPDYSNWKELSSRKSNDNTYSYSFKEYGRFVDK